MRDVIYIACDDSGAEAKSWIIEYLNSHGYECQDQGGDETPSRYPYYAAKVAAAVSRGEIRRHNDSNILCLGGRMVGRWMLLRIVETWLTTEYDGGHHQGSLDLLAEMERAMLSESVWCPPELPYEPFNWDPKQAL